MQFSFTAAEQSFKQALEVLIDFIKCLEQALAPLAVEFGDALPQPGDGLFKVIETLYNPNHFDRAIESWKAAKLTYDERRERRAKRLSEREAKARAMTPDD